MDFENPMDLLPYSPILSRIGPAGTGGYDCRIELCGYKMDSGGHFDCKVTKAAALEACYWTTTGKYDGGRGEQGSSCMGLKVMR